MAALVQRGDVLLGVDELELGRDEEVSTGDLARAVDGDGRRALVDRRAVRAEHEALHVEDDVGDILHHVRDGHELVRRRLVDLFDLNLRPNEF